MSEGSNISIVYTEVKVSKKIPKEAELREVLIEVCQVVDFEDGNVELDIYSMTNKNPRGASFRLQSVKREDRYAISVEILGDNLVAIGRLFRKDKNGVQMSGQAIYEHIYNKFGNLRVYKMGQYKKTRNINSSNPGTVTEDGESKDFRVDGQSDTLDKKDGNVTTLICDPATTSVCGLENPTNYIGFFKERARLQLAIIALCARYEFPNQFSSKEFTQTLREDVGVNCHLNAAIPILASFTRQGYINRVNPKKHPASYQMTSEAISFASADLSKSPPGESGMRRSTKIQPPINTHKSSVDRVAYLKEREKHYQNLQLEIEHINRSQSQSIGDSFYAERTALEHERVVLEENLLLISNRLDEISSMEEKKKQEFKKRVDLESQLRDSELQGDLKELADIKAMLGG